MRDVVLNCYVVIDTYFAGFLVLLIGLITVITEFSFPMIVSKTNSNAALQMDFPYPVGNEMKTSLPETKAIIASA